MKASMMKTKVLVAALLTLTACSAKQEKGLVRNSGGEIAGVGQQNFHAHDASTGACDRVFQLSAQLTPASDAFSVLDKFSFEVAEGRPANIMAAVKTGESPLFMNVLGSEKLKPVIESQTPDFVDFAKVELKIGTCPLEGAANWGFGCRGLWAQTAGAQGCRIDDANMPDKCKAIWARVLQVKEIGKCAYVETGNPNDGDAFCAESKQNWGMLQFAVGANMVHMAKNKVLQDKFPGIFGAEGPAGKSLFLGLAAKVRGFFALGPAESSRILTAKLPLFSADRTWGSLARDMDVSTGAWVRGATGETLDNKLCSFVLAQRAFAQMLTMNGFLAPELAEGHALPLAADRNSLGTVPRPGAYLAAGADGTMQPTILSLATLADYNPATQLVIGALRVPKTGEAPNMLPETLTDRLDRMTAIELFFEATSPLAAWAPAGQPYLLGDIEDQASAAVLPYEAHALAFGHLALGFKNLAALNIKPIKADGSIVTSPNDVPLGFVLMRSLSADFKGEMWLSDLAKFAKIIVRLDDALTKTLAADQAQLAQKNPFYSAAIRPKLMEMRGQLRRLKLPVQALMYQMRNATDPRNGQKFCASRLIMDIAPVATGLRRIPRAVCQQGDAVDREYQEARQMMSASLLQEPAGK